MIPPFLLGRASVSCSEAGDDSAHRRDAAGRSAAAGGGGAAVVVVGLGNLDHAGEHHVPL